MLITFKDPGSDMLKTCLIIQLQKSYQEFLQSVKNFPSQYRESVLFDKWSLKDVLAHIVAWNKIDTLRLLSAKNGGEYRWIKDLDSFNKVEVNKTKNLPWEKVYSNLIESHTELIQVLQEIPENKLTIKIDPEQRFSIQDDIQSTIDHYQNGHIPQINKVLGKINEV